MSFKALHYPGNTYSLQTHATQSFNCKLSRLWLLHTRVRNVIILILLLCSWGGLVANADSLCTKVLYNMPELVPLRDPSESHGNLYGKDDTAFIAARYDLPTCGFTIGPEKVQVTYFTKVTLVFSDYPQGNKIVVNWGDAYGSISTVYATNTNTTAIHQYNPQVQSYPVTIKTYRPSGSTYIEEPEHEINYEVGIFPYNETEEVATLDGNAVGNLTIYRSPTSGRIKKPILIIEGFSLHNTNTISNIIGLNPYFYRNLLNDGFDMYILTFANAQNSLYVNAGLVLSALSSIKAKHSPGGEYATYGCQPVKVIGYSMGGVLARIALACAEDNNEFAHGSNLLMTVDSPHRGFVINQNLQEGFIEFVDTLIGMAQDDQSLEDQLEDLISTFSSIVNSPIARHLLRNNITANTLPYSFIDGSDEYRSVFDFLNPCDAYNVTHINQDDAYYNSGSYNPQMDFKSGFPWKQNHIRKYAVAFGAHDAIGNTDNSLNFAIIKGTLKLLWLHESWDIANIESEWYDTCPASYFPTELHIQQKVPSLGYGPEISDINIIDWIVNALDMRIKLISIMTCL